MRKAAVSGGSGPGGAQEDLEQELDPELVRVLVGVVRAKDAEAFAAYAEVKQTAASVPLNLAIAFSSSTCRAWVPERVR